MEQLRMDIEGMSCGHCVSAVKRALGELDAVTVDALSVGHAEVTYDATKVDAQAIFDAVKEAGYPAHAAAGAA